MSEPEQSGNASTKGGAHEKSRKVSPVVLRIGIGVLAGLMVLGGAYLFAVLQTGGVIRPGTSVAGVDIGGLTRAEAVKKLQTTIAADARKRFTVIAGEDSFNLRPRSVGVSFNIADSIQGSYAREWNPMALIGGFFTSDEREPVVTVDLPALEDHLASIAEAVNTPPVEPTLTVKANSVVLTPGEPGRELNTEALADSIVEKLFDPRVPMEAPLVTVEPAISAEAAQEAQALAEKAISAPITVQAGEVSAELSPRAIANALTFTQDGSALVPQLDGAKLHAAISGDLAEVETPGQDATFRIRKGAVEVVPAVVGTGIEDDELALAVTEVLGASGAARTATVSFGTRPPALTTEAAAELGVTEKLSSFTQTFPYAAYRSTNIGEAARRLNGTLLLPGETFSMNDTIKERTVENGYTVGTVIGTGGVFDEQLGGGVSTATTAMWTAAFFAGMERIETRAHSIYISRYAPGLEATVAWGIFDMKFRNDTPYGVFITAKATGTSIKVTFWGTKMYDEIKAEFGPKENIKEFSTIKKKQTTKQGCSTQSGINGFDINVDRVFYKGGKEVKRETITTRYRPAPEVKCGVKKKKKGAEGDLDVELGGGELDSVELPEPAAPEGDQIPLAAGVAPNRSVA